MKLIKHKIISNFKEKRKTKEKKEVLKISLIIILLYIYFYLIFIYSKKIIIEVDISKAKYKGGGPIQLQKGIKYILPYETAKCKFIPIDGLYPIPINEKKYVDYFYLSFPCMRESTYDRWKSYNRTKNLLLGPCFVPNHWRYFPMNRYWKERRFREILKSIKAVVVHSLRVRNHLAKRSNNTDLLNKFILLRPCTYVMPEFIKPFNERNIDIILYEKYPDSKHYEQGNQLFKLLKSTNFVIKRLLYSKYKRNDEFLLAENSKFVIYFSFYDTGAIALKEIQNYGVIAFTLKKILLLII